MSWRQMGSRPLATTMLTLQWLKNIIQVILRIIAFERLNTPCPRGQGVGNPSFFVTAGFLFSKWYCAMIWGLWCQKRVSQAWIGNCIEQYSVGCNYLFLPEIPVLAPKSVYAIYTFRQSQTRAHGKANIQPINVNHRLVIGIRSNLFVTRSPNFSKILTKDTYVFHRVAFIIFLSLNYILHLSLSRHICNIVI